LHSQKNVCHESHRRNNLFREAIMSSCLHLTSVVVQWEYKTHLRLEFLQFKHYFSSLTIHISFHYWTMQNFFLWSVWVKWFISCLWQRSKVIHDFWLCRVVYVESSKFVQRCSISILSFTVVWKRILPIQYILTIVLTNPTVPFKKQSVCFWVAKRLSPYMHGRFSCCKWILLVQISCLSSWVALLNLISLFSFLSVYFSGKFKLEIAFQRSKAVGGFF